jgi:hypothetical protein
MIARGRWVAVFPRFATLPLIVLAAATAPAAEPTAPASVDGSPGVTFNKHVAPLVYRRCATCHRPGEVAPFSLLTYRDVSKRARLIRTVTGERSMPPWKAEPGAGHFADERRLSDQEIATLARWVEAGTPEGDPADLPPPPRFAEGWQLGEPDVVLTMSEPYTLDAEGRDVYRCFVIPLKVPEGKSIRAIEYRAGNRRIVHHAVLSALPHETALKKLEEGDGKSFASGLSPPGQLLPGQLAFWTPGIEPRPLPEGYAAVWPAGADLILQLHLHPSGKPESEQSLLGLHFSDEKPKGRLQLMILSNNKINIPPGEANYELTASRTLKQDAAVHGIFPHMHLIGRTVKVTATLPDGMTEPLISIGDWNFNWQHYFQYAEPLRLPAGTRLDAKFTYDNSESNPANPNRPPQPVTYGEQTGNEMGIVVLDLIPTGPPPAVSDAERRAKIERWVSEFMQKADRNGDGKLDVDEAVAASDGKDTVQEVERRIAEFDRDGDKRLNRAEMQAALDALSRR